MQFRHGVVFSLLTSAVVLSQRGILCTPLVMDDSRMSLWDYVLCRSLHPIRSILCVSMCIYVYLCVSMCIYVYLCVSMCIYVLCMCMYMYAYVYVCVCVCMCNVSMYLCIYVYVYAVPVPEHAIYTVLHTGNQSLKAASELLPRDCHHQRCAARFLGTCILVRASGTKISGHPWVVVQRCKVQGCGANFGSYVDVGVVSYLGPSQTS